MLIDIAGIPRSSYYYHTTQLGKPNKYVVEKEEIQAIYKDNKGRMGYRRIAIEMRNRGHHINHKTVLKLMRQLGIKCQVRAKKYRSYRGNVGKIAANLLERDFQAAVPNKKWVTDVTEFSLFGKKVYLSPIMDLFNGEIVSYSIGFYPRFSQTLEMLELAFAKIPDGTNLILHSDQGWQYQMKPYQRLLKAKGIRQSMSRKGNCLDNAVMENFFGILKTELFYLQVFDSLEHFMQELVDYIDYYNNCRIKQKLKGMSPVQFRLHTLQSA